jgi:hypothetical protein
MNNKLPTSHGDLTNDQIIEEAKKVKAPCRVKITKCSFELGWYRNRIGEEFDVDNAGGDYDYIVWEDYVDQKAITWRHILKKDCILL